MDKLSKPILLELYYYIYSPNYKLLDWIPFEKLDIINLKINRHPGFIDVLLSEKVYIDPVYITPSNLKNINPRIEEFLNKVSLERRERIDSLPKSEPQYKLLFSNINFETTVDNSPADLINDPIKLCRNPTPKTVDFLKDNINTLSEECWIELCTRSNFSVVTELLERYPSRLTAECWLELCRNPNQVVVKFLEKNKDKLDIYCWQTLCYNHNDTVVAKLLYPNTNLLDYTCWENLCYNLRSKIGANIIKKNIDKLNIECFEVLCRNPYSDILTFVSTITNKLDLYCWFNLCKNKNQIVVDIIKNNLDKFPLRCWEKLCKNTHLDIYKLLYDNIDKLDDRCWAILCKNTRTDILKKIIEKNVFRLSHRLCWYNCWSNLCENTNQVSIDILKIASFHLENNMGFWHKISGNPNIFEIDNDLTKSIRDQWYKDYIEKIHS
jgi:hypothetical protein